MKIVETKTYEIKMTTTERNNLKIIAEELRKIEKEIDNIIGDDHPISINFDTYTGNDLWRAAELLDGIALDGYEIE